MITQKKIEIDLQQKIESKATLNQIADWAYEIFYANVNELDSKLENILITLYSMQGGPEYHLTDLQLRSLALDLIYSEEGEPISKEWIGLELLKMLAAQKNIKEIASWAYEIYYSSENLSEEVKDIVIEISMSNEPQFECTTSELAFLADLLICGEQEPFRSSILIHEHKSEGN